MILSQHNNVHLGTGVRCADGWCWSDWYIPTGSNLELQWRPGEVWLYDARGLIASAVGDATDSHLARVLVLANRPVTVDPMPAETR